MSTYPIDDLALPGSVDEQVDRPYVDALASNPAWQAMSERIAEDASAMIQKLIAMKPSPGQSMEVFYADVDALRAEIRGVLRVLEEPVVIRRAIDARRDR